MKFAILKAVAVFTLALSLIVAGVAAAGAVDTGNNYVALDYYDGPYNEGIEY